MACSGRQILVGLAAIALLIMWGCGETTEVLEPEELNPPLGLSSVTGHGRVHLVWYTSNFESDLDGYCVYGYEGDYGTLDSRKYIPAGFDSIGCIEVSGASSEPVDVTITGLDNGQTYSFLVVAAMDDWSKISYTSNVVVDTPRPEVHNLVLKDQNKGEGDCALEFSSTAPYVEVVDDTDPGAAVMFESFNCGAGKRPGLVGVEGRAQVQDLGFMSSWDIADVAPEGGYPASNFSVTALEFHVYAVKTSANHYAKIYLADVTGNPDTNTDVATVWVAYQTDAGNPELAPRRR